MRLAHMTECVASDCKVASIVPFAVSELSAHSGPQSL